MGKLLSLQKTTRTVFRGLGPLQELLAEADAYTESYPCLEQEAARLFAAGPSELATIDKATIGPSETLVAYAPTAKLLAFLERCRRHHAAAAKAVA